MKVIPETLRFYYYRCVDTSADALLVPAGIVRQVVRTSALT